MRINKITKGNFALENTREIRPQDFEQGAYLGFLNVIPDASLAVSYWQYHTAIFLCGFHPIKWLKQISLNTSVKKICTKIKTYTTCG